ncbi:MAG: Hint domain-containing protein [Marinovum sp.]|nr:Hint domain-containing protein [Marinovum sp.]
MNTGFRGTFVISWSQTETDGFKGAAPHSLAVGATWAWEGDPLRVDGPASVLRLNGALGSESLRRSAARMVRRLVGVAVTREAPADTTTQDDTDSGFHDSSFVVTDGTRSYTVTVIPTEPGRPPLAMFIDDVPPARKDLWVVHHNLDTTATSGLGDVDGGVICFTPGTLIDTPDGKKQVEHLYPGDMVLTKDNGPQEILWRGARRMTGARLFVMPKLRPIRIQAAAFGHDLPNSSFLVSPEHKMMVRGPVARELFNTDEVLVSAKHLVNHDTISVDLNAREITYIHLMLARHEVLWANGMETESFHPANTSLASLTEDDRKSLLQAIPALASDPHVYGAYARRSLSDSEAALLAHVA